MIHITSNGDRRSMSKAVGHGHRRQVLSITGQRQWHRKQFICERILFPALEPEIFLGFCLSYIVWASDQIEQEVRG